MRMLASVPLLLVAASAAGAQTKPATPKAGSVYSYSFSNARESGDRPMLGVTTSAGDTRDTLGLLVSDVSPGSPAEKAGIEEGNRLLSVNGVNLKVAREDAGDPEMASAMSNRLRREIGKHAAGDEVSVDVLAAGKVRTVKVKLATSADIEKASRSEDADHGVLGVSLSASGSKRDTAGIFIAGVSDGSPADKAGIAEGDRIASINGVDLRAPKEDAGDASVAGAKFQRLQRELRKVKAGQAVDLVVVSGGKSRTLKVTTAKASELKDFGGVNIRMGDGMMGVPGGMIFNRRLPEPPMPPEAPTAPRAPGAPRVRVFRNDADGMSFDFDGLGPEVRRKIEIEVPRALERAHDRLQELQLELPVLRSRIIRKVVI